MSTFALKRGYELQLPTSYVDMNRDEMEYVDGTGWIANLCGTSGAAAGAIAAGIIGAAAGSALGTCVIPIIGTISWAVVGAVAGAATGFRQGWVTGYAFGREIENALWS